MATPTAAPFGTPSNYVSHDLILALFRQANVSPSAEYAGDPNARIDNIVKQVQAGTRTLAQVQASIQGVAQRNPGATFSTPANQPVSGGSAPTIAQAPGPQTSQAPPPEGVSGDNQTLISNPEQPQPGLVDDAAPLTLEEQALAARELLADDMATVAAQSGIPPELVGVWVAEWVRTGNAQLALAATRKHSSYDTYYPGNRREDGTFRYTETQYGQIVESFDDSLRKYDVNPAPYRHLYGGLIGGNKSPAEFDSLVGALHDRFFNAPPEQLQAFGKVFGLDNPTASQALAVALNPKGVGQEVLERKLNIAELVGTAAQFGFDRSVARGGQFADQGVTRDQARSFYSTAASALPVFSGIAGRSNESPFGLQELEGAALLFDPKQRQRLESLGRREVSRFSRSATVSQGNAGDLTGLGAR